MLVGSNLMVFQISIRISGPGVSGDEQSGFFLGWILAGGVLVLMCLLMGAVPNWKSLPWWTGSFL